MKIDASIVIAAVFLLLWCSPIRTCSQSLDDAREDFATLHFEEAQAKLMEIAVKSGGSEKQDALLMIAKLKRSPEEAEIIYQEVISLDPESKEAKEAFLEMAKIRYAAGRYKEALQILQGALSCEHNEEACYFEGLSALMAKDLDLARRAFSRIKRGRLRTWSALSLAEIEMQENDVQSACSHYEALSEAAINPVAMYRFGECQEKRGDINAALRTFNEIVTNFQSTPEAIHASEKIKMLTRSDKLIEPQSELTSENVEIKSGFTIQFGSFQERRNAIKLAEKIRKTIPGVRIDTDSVDSRQVHRVRYGYFKTRIEAQAKADELRGKIDGELTIMKIP